jgi:hypothetical protein
LWGGRRAAVSSHLGPGGAVFAAAEAGGDEAVDVGVGAWAIVVGCAGRGGAPDDRDPIALGKLGDGRDEHGGLETQVAHDGRQAHAAAASREVGEQAVGLWWKMVAVGGIVGHGLRIPRLRMAGIRGRSGTLGATPSTVCGRSKPRDGSSGQARG